MEQIIYINSGQHNGVLLNKFKTSQINFVAVYVADDRSSCDVLDYISPVQHWFNSQEIKPCTNYSILYIIVKMR